MAKGYGVEMGDIVLVSALGIGAYFVYQAVVKPVSSITQPVGDLVGGVANTGSDILKAFRNFINNPSSDQINGFDVINSVGNWWQDLTTGNYSPSISAKQAQDDFIANLPYLTAPTLSINDLMGKSTYKLL